jgi:hypothetical protein
MEEDQPVAGSGISAVSGVIQAQPKPAQLLTINKKQAVFQVRACGRC